MIHNIYSRREFLKISGAATSALFLNNTHHDNKTDIKIGTQLYCVRHECAADFAGTLRKVASAGFRGVEFADYFGFSASEIRKMLDDTGLEACGTHIYKETLLGDELNKTIEFNATLKNKYLIVRSFPDELRTKSSAWYELAGQLNKIAEKLKVHDMQVGYHNHDYEFLKLDSGEIAWDILADNTSKDVVLQLDTGNCSAARVDPLLYLTRNPGRTQTSHIKPWSASNPEAFIGDDEINWQKAIQLYQKISGIDWYIIEYEHDIENSTPLQSLKANMVNFLKLINT